jgi:hypothetical protein
MLEKYVCELEIGDIIWGTALGFDAIDPCTEFHTFADERRLKYLGIVSEEPLLVLDLRIFQSTSQKTFGIKVCSQSSIRWIFLYSHRRVGLI